MTKGYDALIIGAGLHGACTAMSLAQRGLKVAFLDKGVGGRHSSASNAGGVRKLNRLPAEIPLSVEASDMWENIEKIVGDNCGFVQSGQIQIAESASDMKMLEERLKLVKKLGYSHEELIDGAELRRRLPAVAERCVGGLMCRSDGFASPFRSTQAFQLQAVREGADFYPGHEVIQISKIASLWRVETSKENFEAELIVNCAGAWGDQIAKMIGDAVPISPEAPTMMVTAPMELFLKPVVIAASRKLSFKQAPNGILLIGGGYRGSLNRDTGETTVDFDGLKQSAQTVIDFFPHLKNVNVVRTWCGIEGLTPDRIPYIGQSKIDTTAYHAFAFSSHGFQLAPIVGPLLAELILDGKAHLPLKPFAVDRFSKEAKQEPTQTITSDSPVSHDEMLKHARK